MMRKGFTLIELLGVIIILGIISLIAFPIINNSIKDSREKAYQETVKNIEQVAYYYSIENDLGEPSIFKKLPLQELKKEGHLKDNEIINPINNETMNGCVKYKWNEATKKYIFEYSDTCEFPTDNSCFDYEDVSVVVSYDIDYEGCVAAFTDESSTTEEIAEFQKICGGNYYSEETMLMDINEYINYFGSFQGSISYDILEKEGYIKNVVRESGVKITNYKCGGPIVGFDEESEKYIFGIGDESNPILPEYINEKPVLVIGESAFSLTENNNSSVKSVVLPKTLRYIDINAFYMSGLEEITFNDNLLIIAMSAFSQNQIRILSLPNSLLCIGPAAFQLNSIETVKFGNKISLINDSVFSYNKIKQISIPESVGLIRKYAFAENSLTTLVIPSNVRYISELTFGMNKLTNVTVPNTTLILGGSFNDNQFADENAFFYARNGDGTIDYSTVVSYGGKKKDNVIIPNTVTNIGESAFALAKINSVTIPEGVVNIEGGAFESNNLTSINLPSTLTTIGTRVFRYNNLSTVTIPENVTSIGIMTFYKYISKYDDTNNSNPNLIKIVNKTGKPFNWIRIISTSSSTSTFVSGTVKTSYGNVSITTK